MNVFLSVFRITVGLVLSGMVIAQTSAQSPCSSGNPIRIVVIGSSTAAGTGPSPVDSAWVWRYRAYAQSLNPLNEVINIAQGGYTTYQMMPTGYIPPAGRPQPDTLRNITRALSLNPDAILINFPSNDVSSGFSVAEQLRNDSVVWAIAQSAGVPVWISTTQPKNFGAGSTNTQKQIAVKDSLLARYGSHVLDFWSVIADSNGQITPAYNSGDGTHLNNAGHWILFNRVIDAHVFYSLVVTTATPDHFGIDLSVDAASNCGDINTEIQFVLANRGPDNLVPLPVTSRITELISGNQWMLYDTLPNGQINCVADTIHFYFDATLGGQFQVETWCNGAGDNDLSNDTLRVIRNFSGVPVPQVIGDTGCSSTGLILTAIGNPDDHYYWYNSDTGSSIIGQDQQFFTPILNASDTFWVEAVRGDLFYKNSIFTTSSATVNWNGAMLDIVANQSLVVDSFSLKINSTGTQLVRAYAKPGTHIGFEQSPSAWTYLGERTVVVTDPDSLISISWDTIPMVAGDTLGMYFHMTNSGSTLRYRGISSPITRSTPEMDVITGSGVSYTFGANYFPRDLNCEVFYHFGSRPEGECTTGRIPVPAVISIPEVDLGPDTILNINSQYLLNPGPGYTNFQWSDGSGGPTLLLDGNVLGTGIYEIQLAATDSAGCIGYDTVIVVFAPLVSVANSGLSMVEIWPNPVKSQIHWKFLNLSGISIQTIRIIGLTGGEMQIVHNQPLEGFLDTNELKSGIYFVEFTLSDGKKIVQKMIKIE